MYDIVLIHSTVPAPDLDSPFSPNILSRLEAIGIPAQTELAKSQDMASSSLLTGGQQTWRNFFQVLEEFKLGQLAQEIKDCLGPGSSEQRKYDQMSSPTTDDVSEHNAAAITKVTNLDFLSQECKGVAVKGKEGIQ